MNLETPPPEPVRPPPPPPPRAAPSRTRRAWAWVTRHHLPSCFAIVVFATTVIASQVVDRTDFANSELARGVEERWGAPVVQPAPSLRAVQSGTLFTELKPLPFDQQDVQVQAEMNYRKRGLRYFSGFDFTLSADYAALNREGHDIDVAFIFPIEVDKSQVLLSDLKFLVDGVEADLDLGEDSNRLMWTGRIPQGTTRRFSIRYRARGLDSFLYKLDPSLPAHDVRLRVGVSGGENFDYPPQVLAASSVERGPGSVSLGWSFASLESGVTMGVILPSVEAYDEIIAVMARRAWVPFLGFMALLAAFSIHHRRPLAFYESWLVAAAYGFYFVLLAYLAAFMNFYLAYVLATGGMGAAMVLYVRRLYPQERASRFVGVWIAAIGVPTAAVILQGYTGLIYTLEILAALLGLMALSTRAEVRALLSDLPPGGGLPGASSSPPASEAM